MDKIYTVYTCNGTSAIRTSAWDVVLYVLRGLSEGAWVSATENGVEKDVTPLR